MAWSRDHLQSPAQQEILRDKTGNELGFNNHLSGRTTHSRQHAQHKVTQGLETRNRGTHVVTQACTPPCHWQGGIQVQHSHSTPAISDKTAAWQKELRWQKRLQGNAPQKNGLHTFLTRIDAARVTHPLHCTHHSTYSHVTTNPHTNRRVNTPPPTTAVHARRHLPSQRLAAENPPATTAGPRVLLSYVAGQACAFAQAAAAQRCVQHNRQPGSSRGNRSHQPAAASAAAARNSHHKRVKRKTQCSPAACRA